MKPLLLHGPAIVSSRKKLKEIKDKFSGEVIVFEKGSDPTTILSSLETVSMFDNERLVIVENSSDDLLGKISSNLQPSTNLTLWFDKELDAKKLPKDFEILLFPEEKEASIFPLLDLLGNRNPKAYSELSRTRPDGSDTQYLFTMICYLLRTLLVTPKTSPAFVKQKIAKQKANFTHNELVNLYKLVLQSDYKIKSGLLEPTQAEFNVINKFVN